MPVWLRKNYFKKLLLDYQKDRDPNLTEEKFFRTSLSHAASAFYPPFESAIVLTADGVGEWATTTVAIGKGSDLEIKKNTFSSFIRIIVFSFYILYWF